jgi:hypothetical protein
MLNTYLHLGNYFTMVMIDFQYMQMDGCSVQCWNLMFMQKENLMFMQKEISFMCCFLRMEITGAQVLNISSLWNAAYKYYEFRVFSYCEKLEKIVYFVIWCIATEWNVLFSLWAISYKEICYWEFAWSCADIYSRKGCVKSETSSAYG